MNIEKFKTMFAITKPIIAKPIWDFSSPVSEELLVITPKQM